MWFPYHNHEAFVKYSTVYSDDKLWYVGNDDNKDSFLMLLYKISDLTTMMFDSCDLSAPQKAKAFHKPALKVNI